MGDSQENSLGRKLAVLAKLRGLTQDQIAKRCSMSRISVNRFFKEHTEIRAGDLCSMLQTLGINLNELIDGAIDTQMNGSESPEEPIPLSGQRELHTNQREPFQTLFAGQVLIPKLAAG